MELKAGTVSDARKWIKSIQLAAKGLAVPAAVSNGKSAAAGVEAPPLISAAAASSSSSSSSSAASVVAVASATSEPAAALAATLAAVTVSTPASADATTNPETAPGSEAAVATKWRIIRSAESQPYYYNTVTGETSWDMPAEGFTEA